MKLTRSTNLNLLAIAYVTAFLMILVVSLVDTLFSQNSVETISSFIDFLMFLFVLPCIAFPISVPYFAIVIFIGLKLNWFEVFNYQKTIKIKFIILSLLFFLWFLFSLWIIEIGASV